MNATQALAGIINAANANSHPIHYKVKEAIDKARDVANSPCVKRYAIISTTTNAWEFESEDLTDIKERFADLRTEAEEGTGYVLVSILDEIGD